MKPKHTPGPWHVENTFDVVYGSLMGIAVCNRRKKADKFEPGWEEAGANARLIASSPQLLEALQAAVDFVDNMPTDDDEQCRLHLRAQKEFADSARAAIAKATGEDAP